MLPNSQQLWAVWIYLKETREQVKMLLPLQRRPTNIEAIGLEESHVQEGRPPVECLPNQ